MASSRGGTRGGLRGDAVPRERARREAVARLIDQLGELDENAIGVAMRELMVIGPAVLDPLGRASARARGARALAPLHRRLIIATLGLLYREDPQAVGALLQRRMLHDPDDTVRHVAERVFVHALQETCLGETYSRIMYLVELGLPACPGVPSDALRIGVAVALALDDRPRP